MTDVPEEEIEGLLDDEQYSDHKSLLEVENSTSKGLSSVYEETDFPLPQQKFMFKFPTEMEKLLQPLDDRLIGVCQKLKGKFFLGLDLVITGCSAIETGIAAPFVMFAVGWDGAATELTYLMLILSLFSQFPKRFVWRWRPYMVWRAQKLRKSETAVTSSFPSRAVTCATVYAFMVVYAYVYDVQKSVILITWWMPFVIIVAVLLSSFARVNLGVHYPTDCIFGFLQGIVVCIVGTMLWHADAAGCDSCFAGKCYSSPGTSSLIDSTHLERVNFIALAVGIVVALIIVGISVIKPVDFWSKCDRVYGMLLPGILFQVTFLCKRTTGSSLAPPIQSPWYGYIYGLAFAGLATLIAWKNNGKNPMLSFGILFTLVFLGLTIWRVWVLPTM